MIVPGAAHTLPTLWTVSTLPTLDEARTNLAAREGMPGPRDVHGVQRGAAPIGTPDPATAAAVTAWLPSGLDAALWTGLPAEPTWLDAGGRLVDDAVIEFARSLDGDELTRAREYVANAPEQTATPLRSRLLAALGR